MKKILLLLLLFPILYSGKLSAQLADGTIAPDFTVTDINGNSHHLYNMLSQGKPVLLEFFTTWCVPCMQMHDERVLQTIDSTYGPNGIHANALQVLAVECDVNTDSADLYSFYDWITGTSYPTVDLDASNIQVASDYAINYVPTMYVICPDHKVYLVPNWLIIDPYLISMATNCNWNLDLLTRHVDPEGELLCTNPMYPSVMLFNNGNYNVTQAVLEYNIDNVPMQTYNWNGLILSGDSLNVTLPSMNVSPTGAHRLFVHTTLVNNTVDDFPADDIDSALVIIQNNAAVSPPYSEGFTGNFSSTGIIVYNPGYGATWQRDTAAGGFGNSQESISISQMYVAEYNLHDDFYLPPVDLLWTTSASLSFNVAMHKGNQYNHDTLGVFVSTDCGANWTQVYEVNSYTFYTDSISPTYPFIPPATSWVNQTVNLTPFIWQGNVTVRFAFKGYFGGEWYIDDINLSAVTGINEAEENSFAAYPNPANDVINVQTKQQLSDNAFYHVFNIAGEMVMSGNLQASESNFQLDVSALKDGCYLLEIVSGNEKFSKVIVVGE